MNIEDKLELVKNSQVIVGIKEGMFVRFYEQSLFGWQQWVSTQPQLPTLKVLVKKVKKLDDHEIVYGGLPIESLTRHGIDVGNENTILLKDEIDLSGWDKWRAEQTNKVANMAAFFKVVVTGCLLIKQPLFLDLGERHQLVRSS